MKAKEFFKKIGMLFWLVCLLIASFGAISTEDLVFIVCGVVSIVGIFYALYKFFSKPKSK